MVGTFGTGRIQAKSAAVPEYWICTTAVIEPSSSIEKRMFSPLCSIGCELQKKPPHACAGDEGAKASAAASGAMRTARRAWLCMADSHARVEQDAYRRNPERKPAEHCADPCHLFRA